ncbi:hypothetical protein HDU96_003881 [Phlyctochytrium bullatum]|nr:hypothetical protein HDU96_003881 [Phlyctochytrium bullatum]
MRRHPVWGADFGSFGMGHALARIAWNHLKPVEHLRIRNLVNDLYHQELIHDLIHIFSQNNQQLHRGQNYYSSNVNPNYHWPRRRIRIPERLVPPFSGSDNGGGANVGLIAGLVVGLVVLIATAVAGFFWFRHKRSSSSNPAATGITGLSGGPGALPPQPYIPEPYVPEPYLPKPTTVISMPPMTAAPNSGTVGSTVSGSVASTAAPDKAADGLFANVNVSVPQHELSIRDEKALFPANTYSNPSADASAAQLRYTGASAAVAMVPQHAPVVPGQSQIGYHLYQGQQMGYAYQTGYPQHAAYAEQGGYPRQRAA